MDFVSMAFLGFIFILSVVYFIVPQKMQWLILLIGSYIFYMASGFKLAFFLLLTTFLTFSAGIWIDKIGKKAAEYLKQHKAEMTREERKEFKNVNLSKKKKILVVTIILNLGILVFLKYFNFLGGNVNNLLDLFHISRKIPELSLLLPLGISFYTLQAVAYIMDIYRGKITADRNFFQFALFMSFFPQIVQGPIARYDQLAHQLYAMHRFDYDRITKGIQLILWGFMKKLILADRLAVAVNEIFNNSAGYEGLLLLFAGAGYGLQVYADFSGGMDIARGTAQILGIDLTLNFERPYFARSISEFWRRWHITLGSWMRDYVFYPLSLSKGFANLGKKTRRLFGNYIGKKLPTFLSMFIVFLLVGVWHGSSWKYVGYGLWNGIIIVTSILLEPVYIKTAEKLKINTECFGWRFFQMARTFLLCSLGRFFSRAISFKTALDMFKRTITGFNPWTLWDGSFLRLGLTYKDFNIIFLSILILLVVGIYQEKGIKIRETIARQNIYFRWLIYLGALAAVLIYGAYGPGYAASEFIYQQF